MNLCLTLLSLKISRGYFVSSLKMLRQRFRGVEYVILIQHTDDSLRFYLFPYFLEQP